jgi:hypothetical protein
MEITVLAEILSNGTLKPLAQGLIASSICCAGAGIALVIGIISAVITYFRRRRLK